MVVDEPPRPTFHRALGIGIAWLPGRDLDRHARQRSRRLGHEHEMGYRPIRGIDNHERLTYGCVMAVPITDMSPKDAAAVLSRSDPSWTRRLVDELDRTIRTEPLERFTELWDLSNSAAAEVFGVSRQAFSKWLRKGPPPARAAAVADLSTATDLLDRYVKRERIPAVVRRASPDLGDVSLLDLATQGDTRAVAASVAAMFDLRRVQP